jgi:hypothetical protein
MEADVRQRLPSSVPKESVIGAWKSTVEISILAIKTVVLLGCAIWIARTLFKRSARHH